LVTFTVRPVAVARLCRTCGVSWPVETVVVPIRLFPTNNTSTAGVAVRSKILVVV
jgi:hypothetical protein